MRGRFTGGSGKDAADGSRRLLQVISLTINGEKKTLERETSVEEVLRRLEVEASAVAVEVNRKIVHRRLHSTYVLRDGDEVEVVTFVGGG